MRHRRRRIETTGSDGGGGMQVLGLSLFIMLLAFFIVINAISSFEENKSSPVLQSLEQAFASRIAEQGDQQPSVAKSAEKALGEGHVLDRMQALFKSQIPDFDASVNKKRGTMHIEMSWADFNAAVLSLSGGGANQVSGQQEYFLSALVALMKNASAGQPYRMDILLTLEDNPALLHNSEPQTMLRAGRVLTQAAAAIEKTGLPEKYLSIGVKEGKRGMVEIFFQPHIPFNPLSGAAANE